MCRRLGALDDVRHGPIPTSPSGVPGHSTRRSDGRHSDFARLTVYAGSSKFFPDLLANILRFF